MEKLKWTDTQKDDEKQNKRLIPVARIAFLLQVLLLSIYVTINHNNSYNFHNGVCYTQNCTQNYNRINSKFNSNNLKRKL